MEKKYFPIKTDTACQLKWTWSTLHMYTGITKSCHRVDGTLLDVDTFDTFHNTPKKILDRQLMLNGEWPSGGCEYCKDIEQHGGTSDRMMQLTIPNLVPEELELNNTEVNVTPRIVEVYFDNVCNMSCIYCHDCFSSKIQQENDTFGPFSQNGLKIENRAIRHHQYTELLEKLWLWLDNNYTSVYRLHVLGGEPFYQKQLETCLLFLESHSNPNLEFNIVSNLKIDLTKLKIYIERIKNLVLTRKIKRFDLTASIDCWGEESEYIRYGIDMQQWQQNFKYLAEQKWLILNINQTITGLGIKSTVPLIKFINQERKNREIGHYFMTCVNRSHLNPIIFGKGFFDNDFDEILSYMDDSTAHNKIIKEYMRGIKLQLSNSERNEVELLKLKTFLTEMDCRRGTSWKKTFPWLVKELGSVV